MPLPSCHIFNFSLKKCLCPQAWREAKVIPPPKSGKPAFTDSICHLLANLDFFVDQIQCYFSVHKSTDFQYAYREGHSTCTALTQITDDWSEEIDNKIVGDVLLDVSAAFDIVDYNFLLVKRMCYGFSTSAISWIQSYISNRTNNFL